MARKKSSAPAAARTQENGLEPQSKPHQSPRDLSPDNKMNNLKTLNQLLLKEAMEKRFQIDQLKSQIEEINEAQPFASHLEREVCRIVLCSAVAEEAKKGKTLLERLGFVTREKDEIKKSFESVGLERDLMKKEVDLKKREVGELEVKVRDLVRDNDETREKLGQVVIERNEMQRLWRKKEEAFESLKELMEDVEKEMKEMSRKHKEEVDSMMAEIKAHVAKISSLEDESSGFWDIKHRLGGEIRVLKDEVGFLNKEKEGLKLKLIELEERNGEAQQEIGSLRVSIVVLEKEKDDKEEEFELNIRELTLKLEGLKKKVGEISREKDEVEKVKAELKIEILELKKEVASLHLNAMKLEEMCKDYGEKNAQLLDEKDAVKKEFSLLEKEMGEKEKGFEMKIGELVMSLDDLTMKMKKFSVERDELENAWVKQDAEIAELKKEVERLSLNALELEERCRGSGERNTQLQDERDAVMRELNVQKEESGRLELQVEDLKKSKDEFLKKLQQLNASLYAQASEKEERKKQIESLIEDKASLEKSLFAAKEKSKSLVKKMRAAELISEKALSLLKSTTEAMTGAEKAKENGVIDDEEIRPFAEELESIQGAFKSRVTKIEEMNRELEVLQTAVENAKNKKPGLLMWLYPATTTVLAAISLAYATRAR